MFNQKIKNWTDENGVLWGCRLDKKGQEVGTPFKVNDPYYMADSTDIEASKAQDASFINGSNLVVGLSGALIAGAVVVLIGQAIL